MLLLGSVSISFPTLPLVKGSRSNVSSSEDWPSQKLTQEKLIGTDSTLVSLFQQLVCSIGSHPLGRLLISFWWLMLIVVIVVVVVVVVIVAAVVAAVIGYCSSIDLAIADTVILT